VQWAGWDFILEHERTLGQRFLDGLPDRCNLYGLQSMDGRVSTFAFNVDGIPPQTVAERLGDAGYAVWAGDYYAVEVMQRLALPEGAVRVGIVHYNTADEVDGLLRELRRL
jgi:selenocysteine lyase/cysteine desulfurase